MTRPVRVLETMHDKMNKKQYRLSKADKYKYLIKFIPISITLSCESDFLFSNRNPPFKAI